MQLWILDDEIIGLYMDNWIVLDCNNWTEIAYLHHCNPGGRYMNQHTRLNENMDIGLCCLE